eukprot:TRINITY_DN14017_c0_g1_i12.p1 TRINITY_DN14017_c0_g1~~TRINITY_DN14017_c0_g1_i12.p1  ORF type:complete len:175 (+),score=36.06 TRINITY_DN14017_c0_g1_i12:121-645(+)
MLRSLVGSEMCIRDRYINYGNNSRTLDTLGFAPIGHVVEGMDDVVRKFYSGYGEVADACTGLRCRGVDEDRLYLEGNMYVDGEFPLLDVIHSARVIPEMVGRESVWSHVFAVVLLVLSLVLTWIAAHNGGRLPYLPYPEDVDLYQYEMLGAKDGSGSMFSVLDGDAPPTPISST